MLHFLVWATIRRFRRRGVFTLGHGAVTMLISSSAYAADLDLSLGIGPIWAGTVPRFAVTPALTLAFHPAELWMVEVQERFGFVLTGNSRSPGLQDHLSGLFGFSFPRANFAAGPSISFYSMPACGPVWCGRVNGFSAGLHAKSHLFLISERVGIALSADVEYPLLDTEVLPARPTWMLLGGPLVRLR